MGAFIENVLTHMRIHAGSVTITNKENDLNHSHIIASIKYHTAIDLVAFKKPELIRWFLSGYMQYSFNLANNKMHVPYKNHAFKLISEYYSLTKGMAFLIALFTSKNLNKGYSLMKYARTY